MNKIAIFAHIIFSKLMKIVVASDHAGYEMKTGLVEYLKACSFDVEDLGCNSAASVDYPDFGHQIADYIMQQKAEVGISLCGSGNGINMTANKHAGIRSALCWKPEIAALARQHNNANICALPARFISFEEAKAIVDSFLQATFEGGRHQRRIDKIPLT